MDWRYKLHFVEAAERTSVHLRSAACRTRRSCRPGPAVSLGVKYITAIGSWLPLAGLCVSRRDERFRHYHIQCTCRREALATDATGSGGRDGLEEQRPGVASYRRP